MTVTPDQYGAAGNGTTDDTAAVVLAAAAGVVVLNPGKTYKITSSITVPKILNHGGYIDISGTNTVLTGLPVGDDSVPCFKGTGKFISSSAYYSVAWFDGDYLNLMWDFCRRGFSENKRKTVVWPMPLSTVAAARAGAPGVWNLNAALQIDGKENNSIHLRHSTFFGAVYNMEAMIEYSLDAKTEDVAWPMGVDLDCGSNAKFGILIHGGARLCHGDKNRILRPILDGVHIVMDESASDCGELEFEFLEVTKFGRNAVATYGNNTKNILSPRFGKIFSNGARAIWGTAVLVNGTDTLDSFTITTNGINGSAQDKYGHYQNERVYIYSPDTGTGRYAQGTLTVDTLTGVVTAVTVDSAYRGTGFTAGGVIFATAADAYIKLVGATRNGLIEDFFEFQDNVANLCPPYEALAILEASDGTSLAAALGASQKLQIGSLQTHSGRRPLLITRKKAGENPGDLHSFTLHDFAIPLPVYDGKPYLQYTHIDGGSTKCAVEPDSTNKIASIDSTVTNFDFYGVNLQRITGGTGPRVFGNKVRVDGRFACFATLATDTALQVQLPTDSSGSVEFFGQSESGTWATGLIRKGGQLIEIAKGSLTTVATTTLAGNTGTTGFMNVSLVGNVVYLENRRGTTRDFIVLASV